MKTVQLLPWIRTGLAADLPAPPIESLPSQGTVAASVSVGDGSVEQSFALHGPDAVMGLTPGQVCKREPPVNDRDFEPNYFPYIEFKEPDLPWRFTPFGPNSDGHLRPWMVLVIVEEREGVRTELEGQHTVLTIEERAGAELPDLSTSWATAHVQVDEPIGSAEELQRLISDHPEKLRARLLCLRRLKPKTEYIAAVVPAFQQGVAAALDEPLDALGETLIDAWTADTAAVRLPAYVSWRFRTAVDGDFEALMRRLTPVKLPEDVGVRRLSLTNAGARLPRIEGAATRFLGAIVSPSARLQYEPENVEDQFDDAFVDLLEATDVDGDEPVLGPPVYGERYTTGAPWLHNLNRHPAWRAAAALGAATVNAHQEHWMAEAWKQAGDAREANQLVRQGRFASALGQTIQRRLGSLDDDLLLQVSRSVHARLPSTANRMLTVAGALARGNVPRGVVGGALVRVTRADGTAQKAVKLAKQQGPVARRKLDPVATARAAKLNVNRNVVFRPMIGRSVLTADAVGASIVLADVDRSIKTKTSSQAVQLDALRREQLKRAGLDLTFMTPSPAGAVRKARTSVKKSTDAEASRELRVAAQDLRRGLLRAERVHQRIRSRISGGRSLGRGPLPKRVMVPLRFTEPLQPALTGLDPDWLMPGAMGIASESVGLLTIEPRFVEAFLVGANHELHRELRWRGLPAEKNAAPFRNFWSRSGDDVQALDTWRGKLGTHQSYPSEVSVLIIRGALVRRYPDAEFDAVPALWRDEPDPCRIPDPTGTPRQPLFSGRIGLDMYFVGLPIGFDEARGDPVRFRGDVVVAAEQQGRAGFFLRISEPPVGRRFGLDLGEPAAIANATVSADQLSWAHFGTPENGHLPVRNGPLDDVVVSTGADRDRWAHNAASLARQTTQKPVRLLVHASHLLGAA